MLLRGKLDTLQGLLLDRTAGLVRQIEHLLPRGSGFSGTPEGIVSQWMHSAAHRRIILMAGMHRVGLGISTGKFAGTPGAVMATADFSA